jgi:hypothetical protein
MKGDKNFSLTVCAKASVPNNYPFSSIVFIPWTKAEIIPFIFSIPIFSACLYN